MSYTEPPLSGEANSGMVIRKPRSTSHWPNGVVGIVRWVLVVALLISGLEKLVQSRVFHMALLRMGFFSINECNVLAYVIPGLEVASACFIALRRLELVALTVACFLSAAFAAFHAYLACNGVVLPCGCDGLAENRDGAARHWVMSVTCAILFLLSSALMCVHRRRMAPLPSNAAAT